MTPADPIDIAALRARLREYDKTLPRCRGTVEEDRNYAPDFVSEEGRAEWNMTFHHPCCRPEGHDGPCRNTRPVLGWPGFAVVTALLDEVEWLRAEVLAELAHVRDQRDNLQAACDRLRANADARERFLRREGDLLRAAERAAEDAEKGAAACDQIVALLDGFPVENPCPEASRVAEILLEVERLRTHRELCTANLLKGYETGKAEERAAVVAWLRAAPTARMWQQAPMDDAADCIERGEHRREEKP